MAELVDAPGGGSIAGHDDDLSAPVAQLFDIGSDKAVEFGVGLFAVRTMLGVGKVEIFLVRQEVLNCGHHRGAATAGVKNSNFHRYII